MRLQILREKIRAIEWGEQKTHQVYSLGASEINNALPMHGLPSGCLHEFITEGKGATLGFCLSILSRMARAGGPILWCARKPELYTPGLCTFGLLPEQIVFVKVKTIKEGLWVLEEGLRTSSLSAVVAEGFSANLTASRRLQLAAKKSGVTAFLLPSIKRHTHCNLALTRWHISPLPSALAAGLFRDDGIGRMRLHVELQRCRGGFTPLSWDIEWDEETLSFHLASLNRQQKSAPSDLHPVQELHAYRSA